MELETFVKAELPEWQEVRETIRGAAIMFHRGMVGEDHLDKTVMPRIASMIAKLSTPKLELLENLLHNEANFNGLILDAVAACLQARERTS